MCRFICIHCRQNLYFIIGLCIGISLSLILTPILENDCLFTGSLNAYSSDHLPRIRSLSSEIENTEYEPRINLAGKPQKAQKTPQIFTRPRYYSTELGIREKLFVGVLTSQYTVGTRGVAINKTLSHIADKVMFFIDPPGPQKLNISMPGIVGFTDTRKILKPFHMLKYITDNHLDEYDFFFMVKDTTYIKARVLYNLVQHISVSEDVHAGSGKYDPYTAYCSLDAGLLLSNSIVRKVLSSLDWCVKNAFSDSDDDNFGRCILHATNISCQNSVQGQKFTSFQLSRDFNIETDIKRLSKNPSFESALTLYPILEPTSLYKLHLYFSKISLVRNKHDISALRHSIMNMSEIAPGGRNAITWPVGNQGGNIPITRFDVLRWDYFTEQHMYLQSDFNNVQELEGADKADIHYVLNATIEHLETMYEAQLEYRRLVNGYRRFDPSRGMDYRFDLAFRDTSTNKEMHKRVEVCKPLGKVEVVPMPYVTENSRINLVLPVTTDCRDTAQGFMQQYASVCMDKHDKTFLMLVLLYDPSAPGKGNKDDAFLDIKKMALTLSDQYKKDGSKVAWISIKIPTSLMDSYLANEALINFAISDLVVKKFSLESLILMCQPNMDIRQDYLNRVRMNTISQWQIFNPIPFVEFHPDIVYNEVETKSQEFDINKNCGRYDSSNTRHTAFYAKDYLAARKMLEDRIPIVRTDRDITSLVMKLKQRTEWPVTSLYSMFVRYSDLHILRAVEPGLRLRYFDKPCSEPMSSEDQSSQGVYQKCLEAKSLSLGTRSQLARLILDYQANAFKIL